MGGLRIWFSLGNWVEVLARRVVRSLRDHDRLRVAEPPQHVQAMCPSFPMGFTARVETSTAGELQPRRRFGNRWYPHQRYAQTEPQAAPRRGTRAPVDRALHPACQYGQSCALTSTSSTVNSP